MLGKSWKKMQSKFPHIVCIPWPFALQKSLPEKSYLQPYKNSSPLKKMPVAWTWNFTGQYLWNVALAMKTKNSKRSFCTSLSDKATFAHAGFSHYALNGLEVSRGITGQDCSPLSGRADHSAKKFASISRFNPKCLLLSISAYLHNSGLTCHKVITICWFVFMS